MEFKRQNYWIGFALSSAFLLNTHCSGSVELDENGESGSPGGGGSINLGTDLPPEDSGKTGQVDLLFVVDNSVSMADKQEMLRRAIPEMIGDLVNPPCVSGAGEETHAVGGECPDGFVREHAPVNDIHVGVISSSLGGHGSRACPRDEEGWYQDDRAHLIPTVRDGLGNGSAFLKWEGGDAAAADAFIAELSQHVTAVGEKGCGFEAPLEAFYRFLIDPRPPVAMELDANGRAAPTTDGDGEMLIDTELLAQREAFLRPESIVNVIVVTDEDDCSAMDGGDYYSNAGFGYLVAEQTFQMPKATEVCDTNPNDPCCFSCLQAANPPQGCGEAAAACNTSARIAPEDDRPNLRCFENKRRLGVDLLYPTDRYVSALRDRQIIDARSGELVDNPLLTGVGDDEGVVRPHGRVYLTGIVGVPWQDVVTQESLEDPDTFEYLTAEEIAAPTVEVGGRMVSRWDLMLGSPGLADSDHRCQNDPSTEGCGQMPTPPLDPFMIQSIAPREIGAQNPLTGDAIVAATSENPRANNINGHEADHQVPDLLTYSDGGPANDELQFACTFELQTPKIECTPEDVGCDCSDEPSRNRSICQPPAGGPASTNQYYAKAYPGTRILQVLRDFGDNSVVNSICPKTPSQGYIPALSATVARMKERFEEAP